MKIGVTGGIGSGKSTACKLLEKWGFPVYYSDDRGKYLMEHDPQVRNAVQSVFGENAYVNGILNRRYLADQIFQSPEKREALNGIVHPAVKRDYLNWLDMQEAQLTFKESALLFETEAYKELDATILITAPESVRLKRVMQRDAVTEEVVRARMNAQLPDTEKQQLASYIVNNSNFDQLEKDLKAVVDQLQLTIN